MKRLLMAVAVAVILLAAPAAYFASYLIWPCDQRCTPMERADERDVKQLLH